MDSYLVISIGAVLGANTRFLLGGWIGDHASSSFPWGTFVINVTGSLAIGLVLGLAADRAMPWWWRPGFAIGFLGAYTTFSTLMLESWRLAEDGSWGLALLNLTLSVVLGMGAVFAGLTVGRAIG